MRTPFITIAVVLGAALFQATPALAHHSNVAFEVTKVVTITGVVKAFEWRNPHTWVILTIDDGKGGKVDWAVEGPRPGRAAPCRLDQEFSTARRNDYRRYEPGEGRLEDRSGGPCDQGGWHHPAECGTRAAIGSI